MLILPGTAVAQDKPALKAELVKEFVIAGHGNLEKTKQMLEATPSLLNASWDWGNGDFEEAIEGAGHVGNRDIALYLISKGARFTLFVAAMLGKIEIVKPMIEAYPETRLSKGPHGLDLIHHATKGGETALEVLNYLKSKS
ncbi:MAG: hypothetical protein C0490_22075 [Marivirga sp.]|nr:hypothetical protein [Marivirga sp.]